GVGLEDRHDLVDAVGVGLAPVAAQPDVAAHQALLVVDLDAQLRPLGDGGDGAQFAVVVAGAVEALEPAVLPLLLAAVGVGVGADEDLDLDVGVAGHDGDAVLTCDTDIKVKILVRTYAYSYRGQEKWKDGRLQRFDSTCNDDGKLCAVAAVAEGPQLRVKVNNEESLVRGDVWLSSYWRQPDADRVNKVVPILEADT